MPAKSVKRYILIGLGFLFLFLGLIGVFIPVLPTTPFLLLTSVCFIRSSDRLYNWLINHKIFGAILRDYLKHRAVKRNAKIGALIILWISLIVSTVMVPNLIVRLSLITIGIGVSIYIVSLKTLKLTKNQ